MIINPHSNEGSFNFFVTNVANTRPATNYGTAVNFVSGSKSSWVRVLAGTDVTADCYSLTITYRSLASSAANRSSLSDIGIDTSGGTSYVPLIENLSTGNASAGLVLGGCGQTYTFPIFIPAGSSIAVRGQMLASTITAYVQISLSGMPRNVESLVYGQSVETLGLTSGVLGTTLSSLGTTSKSTWTSIGTTTNRWKSIQMGLGFNTTAVSAATARYEVGYGDGTDMVIVNPYVYVMFNSTESLSLFQHTCLCDIPAGSTIYIRGQGTVNPSNSIFAFVYGAY